MSNVVAIASGDLALEFSLAGLRIEEASDSAQAESILDAYLQNPKETFVLIIEDRFRQEFSEWMRERLRRHRGKPLVIYCPAFDTQTLDVDAYMSSVLKPALGYEIRLE